LFLEISFNDAEAPHTLCQFGAIRVVHGSVGLAGTDGLL
jgi:hypothetical protein